MTKGDAASALLGILMVALFVGWIGSIIYAFDRPDSRVGRVLCWLNISLAGAVALGLAGFVIYCIYVLIA